VVKLIPKDIKGTRIKHINSKIVRKNDYLFIVQKA